MSALPSQAQTPTTAAPFIVPDPDATPQIGQIVDYTLGVTCGGQAVQALRTEAPAPLLAIPLSPLGNDQRLAPPIRVSFSIAQDGRAYSVRKAVEASITPAPAPVIVSSFSNTNALEATLMGWRFAPVAQADCELSAQPLSVSMKDADLSLKARAMALGVNRATWGAALLRAMERPGDDCRRRPAFRTTVVGDADVKPPPGAIAWGAYRFDVDAEGRIHHIESLGASPDPDVEATWRQAIGASEFYPGKAKTGCVIVFTRAGDTPSPGPIPMPDWHDLNHCTVEQRARLTLGALPYPEPLRARGIEGWALVRYDLASWGRVGGIEVLQSQPVATFGEQARQIIQNARVTPALEHATQCVDRILFRLSDENRETSDAD